METTPHSTPRLRVLLFSSAGPASVSLTTWLAEQEGLLVCAPASTMHESISLAVEFQPHVVLLDFHGLPVSTGYVVARLKELPLRPAVFVLTHDASAAMRRRCHASGVEAVFDKTAELDALCDALGAALAHADRNIANANQPRPPDPTSRNHELCA